MLGNHALASAPISAQGGRLLEASAEINAAASVSAVLLLNKQLQCSILADANLSGTIDLSKNLSASVTATADTTATIDLSKNLSQVIFVSADTTGTIDLSKNLSASVTATADTTATIDLSKNLSAAIEATNILASILNVDKLLQSSIDITGSISSLLDLNKNLESSIDVTGSISGLAVLQNSAQSSATATASSSGLLDLNKQLSGDISGVISVNSNLTVTVNLQSSVSVSVNTTGTLAIINELSGSIDNSVNTSANISVDKLLDSEIYVFVSSNPPLSLIKNLQAGILVETDIRLGGFNAETAVIASVNIGALLDVNGNTDGSPGGIPVEGFFPPTSVILANHWESWEPETYVITAELSDDPNIITEIVEWSIDDNPADVVSFQSIGNTLNVILNTPAEVYKESSTFLVKRELEPFFGIPVDYVVRFNTVVKQNRNGNNFYSSKFITDTNNVCFLMDDGTGIINLWEENEPGNKNLVGEIGTIDYSTGFISVDMLNIKSRYDPVLFFFVESINQIIPTKDYFEEQNSQLVQSTTVTFPSGEQVEIYQYEKETDVVDLYIFVKARSYHVSDPSTTIETREAIYKLTILPDYDIGKEKLLQLIAEEV